MTDLVLNVNGQNYRGWQQIHVRRSIEQLTGRFDLTVSDRWAIDAQPWTITMGDACTLTLDGERVISGYVDDTLPQFDAQQHQIQVIGRDKTADLVDCSAVWKTGQWNERTLLQIATDLATPFGLTVSASADVGAPFKSFTLAQGESGFEAIERAARMRGLLLTSDADGNLMLGRAGTERVATALVQGKNIKAARGRFSLRDRYSDYRVKGSQPADNWTSAEQAAAPVSEPICDPAVGRHRPLVIIAESAGDNAALTERAIWEAAVRMGRSARAVVTVSGWSHTAGLWQPNRIVPVDCPYLGLQGDMLIAAVDYDRDQDGTRAELELVRPEAFELRAVPEPQEDSSWN